MKDFFPQKPSARDLSPETPGARGTTRSSFNKKANCTAQQLHCHLMTPEQFPFTSKQCFSQLMLKAHSTEKWDGTQLLAVPCLEQQCCLQSRFTPFTPLAAGGHLPVGDGTYSNCQWAGNEAGKQPHHHLFPLGFIPQRRTNGGSFTNLLIFPWVSYKGFVVIIPIALLHVFTTFPGKVRAALCEAITFIFCS